MNTANFERLIENYIERFDEMHCTESNREFYKWDAFKSFGDKWDINATDFVSMLKEAVKDTYNLIDNRMVQPLTGIIKLAERPELTEIIRQMFVDLYSDDEGDIDLRQEKIDVFVGNANSLLEKYEPGKWKYVQDVRTVIAYLNFRFPDQNYMYKATQAHKFKDCIEFSNDFGYGADFRLKRYYQMCDEVKEKIKSNEELIELFHSRKTASMDTEDDYHILVYDIIFCSVVYDLYWNIDIPKPKRKKTTDEIITKKIDAFNEELESLNKELNQLLNEKTSLDEVNAKGLIVSHKLYGEGIVTHHDGYKLTVKFNNTEKQFGLPICFSNNILITDSQEISEVFIRMKKLDDSINLLKNRIVGVKSNIKKLT